jgi:hypothetical protein
MRSLKLASFPLLVLALTVSTAAQAFKPYPGRQQVHASRHSRKP